MTDGMSYRTLTTRRFSGAASVLAQFWAALLKESRRLASPPSSCSLVVIACAATCNEPAPAICPGELPRPVAELTDVLMPISRIAAQLGGEAATGPFDLLSTMVTASRVTSPPATMLLLSSGVSTAGGFDLRKVGWAEPPAMAAADLKQRGLLPDLAGWTVIFAGLGKTAGRQPALPLPQQMTLASYWLAICHATGAAACRVDDTLRPVHGSRSTVPVPVVPVPAVQSITGPQGQQQAIVPADLLFAFSSATLLPSANSYLAPVATGPAPAASRSPSPARRLPTEGAPPTISGSQCRGPRRYNAASSRWASRPGRSRTSTGSAPQANPALSTGRWTRLNAHPLRRVVMALPSIGLAVLAALAATARLPVPGTCLSPSTATHLPTATASYNMALSRARHYGRRHPGHGLGRRCGPSGRHPAAATDHAGPQLDCHSPR